MIEDTVGGDERSLLRGELVAPSHACLGRSAQPGVVVFQIAGGLFIRLITPVVPSLGTYMGAEVTVHEEGVGPGAPGTSEIALVDSGLGIYAAVVEDVTVGLVLGCRGSCDIGVLLVANGAMLKPRRGGSEDEVSGALDVTVAEIEAGTAHTRIDSVLIAQETTVDKAETVSLGVKGHGLSQTGGIVLDRNILQRDEGALYFERIGAKGAHLAIRARDEDIGMVIVGDDGFRHSLIFWV